MPTTASKIQTEKDFDMLKFSAVSSSKDANFKVVQNEYVDSSRWTEIWRIVWTEDGGKTFFAYTYEEPATEYQEGSEAEFDPDEIEEVIPQEVTVVKYVRKEDPAQNTGTLRENASW